MEVVWFKRDLRVYDHAALTQASKRGKVLPLYIVEPELWLQPDMSARHWNFIIETLIQLREDLATLGQPLIIRVGNVIDILSEFLHAGSIESIWSHQETGNGWTYDRDLKVAQWCRLNGIAWHELQNHGVQRPIATRDGWASKWDQLMAEPPSIPPQLAPLDLEPGPIPSSANLQLSPDICPQRQIGGRRLGMERLESFLNQRGENYQQAMSSPLEGAHACSRLSPYLAWGALSMREVVQATKFRQRTFDANAVNWRKSLRSFSGRLHWHCHFIQKLEDEPRLEFENLHRLYNGLRPAEPDSECLTAWASGQTGYPFLDACMRSLNATGWLNFRMRAMVMATASYHLWMDWRAPGLVLARLFTDYEPGIHWNQVQMQSGTTGINAIRIYNPVKQGYDQDSDGIFTRRWVPELSAIADTHLQEPWKAPNSSVVLGKSYPDRIFDHLSAAKLARDRIWSVRRHPDFREEADRIQSKHGSRKRTSKTRKRPPTSQQLSIAFES